MTNRSTTNSTDKLFDEKTLRKFEQLELVAQRVRSGAIKGERRSSKRGTSIEFADYRNYVHGDDLRRVDWNIFARLERPFIKLFEEEEDLAVHLLLDCSASMDYPRVGEDDYNLDHHKFRFAQRVAAGLAHLSLGSGDNLNIVPVGYAQKSGVKTIRGRGRTLELLSYLGELRAEAKFDLNEMLKDYAARLTRPGLALILSDLLSPTGYQDGVSALQARGCDVAIIHILSPEEVQPTLTGDLQLIDSESGTQQSVSLDDSMRQLYTRRLLAWRDEIGAYCLKRGLHYASVETSLPWEALILFELRRLGVVR